MCAYIISVRSLFSMKNISQERKETHFFPKIAYTVTRFFPSDKPHCILNNNNNTRTLFVVVIACRKKNELTYRVKEKKSRRRNLYDGY